MVGAVHIGDAEYYAELTKIFTGYEALLFEMVGGRDGLEKKDLQGTGGIRMLQGMMGKTLELDFQLDGIDYTAENFVHADMDAKTFSLRMKEQGLNLFALMDKVSKWEKKRARERREKGLPDPEMGLTAVIQALLFGGGKDLKLALGRQFGELSGFLTELEDAGAVIIGERNAVALKVLQRTIKEGKKNVGIFYGAAHLPDMEVKLAELGFRRTGLEWKTAWFIPKKAGAERDGAKEEESVPPTTRERQSEPKAETKSERTLEKRRVGRHQRTRKAA